MTGLDNLSSGRVFIAGGKSAPGNTCTRYVAWGRGGDVPGAHGDLVNDEEGFAS